ncbi:DUF6448 family protein [Desulfurivibrio dismutans]|uniref:DUF6448 family protein n=1 Tax=Desulfurivibrio dismutans TaxID=1398908 RepID=UPI0023DBE58E|nr:DUF6448 family protein [Desulfurivibrio alkaliphilus]MDF1614374.1 DUF6448 family protein [Desulfurivibrio alkaliphilus]
MMSGKITHWQKMISALLLAVTLLAPHTATAHCDALDGPVVVEARQAMAAGDPQPLLKWVLPEHEEQIHQTFAKTMQVRELGEEAREVADNYFLETLVRLHRASEGAPYTGIKAAGTIPGPIARADAALAEGSVDELATHVADHVGREMRERFSRALAKKKSAGRSPEAGREFVEAYVQYVHFVEGIVGVISGDHAH